MKHHIRMATLLAASFFISGCILPVPHRRLHSEGMEAKVIAAGTASPVRGATITEADSDRVSHVTDSEGRFKIPARYGWHGAYLIGPISYSLLPHFDMPSPRPSFRIDAEGYQPMTVQPLDTVETDAGNGQATIRLEPE